MNTTLEQKGLVYINVKKIHPHPDNPRKDLGDLSELAESIKSNGVLQNLTVVPWFSSITYAPCDDPKDQAEMGHCVVIGHRRLAAAKLAGLTEVPCVISDMSLREQVATMLLENMQRSDLTIYEQAQGFQMMLNLGDSVSDISNRTGFSSTTVRRRIKLLDLDQEKFKKSTERGATIQEYMELDKINNIDRKNAVLDKIGTPNFQYELKRAVDEEAREARTEALIAALSDFATQVDTETGYRRVTYYYTSNDAAIERPKDADSVEYFFYVASWAIYLMRKDEGQIQQENPEEVKKRECLEWRRTNLSEATERAFDLRKEFIQGLSVTKIKKNMADIVTMAVWEGSISYADIDEAEFIDLLGIDSETVEKDDEGDGISYDGLFTIIAAAPERALLSMAYCLIDDKPGLGYFQSWNAEHRENDGLDRLYDWLENLGYQMSDEERALRDGTHELFKEPKEGDNDEEQTS